MRKYKRLLLILVAIFSIILVLIYRYKYSKLSLIFDVMMAFECRKSETKCEEKIRSIQYSVKNDWSLEEQLDGYPMWTEILQGVHAYSTYWISQKTRTLIFTNNASLNAFHCEHWHNNSNKITKARVHMINEELGFFECLTSSKTIPNSISFKTDESLPKVALPILNKNSSIGIYTACVKPLPIAFNKMDRLIEFIVYHHHIGINHFIFYDSGLSVYIRKLLLEIFPKNGIYITLLPWNAPFKLSSFGTVQGSFIDCLHRVIHRNYSKYVIYLDLNHFIIPTKRNLNEIVSFFKAGQSILKFTEQKFCLEFANDFIAQNLNITFITLLKTKVLQTAESHLPVIYNVQEAKMIAAEKFAFWLFKENSKKFIVVPKSHGLLFSYVNCSIQHDLTKMTFISDQTMWKYKDIFYQSPIYQTSHYLKLLND